MTNSSSIFIKFSRDFHRSLELKASRMFVDYLVKKWRNRISRFILNINFFVKYLEGPSAMSEGLHPKCLPQISRYSSSSVLSWADLPCFLLHWAVILTRKIEFHNEKNGDNDRNWSTYYWFHITVELLWNRKVIRMHSCAMLSSFWHFHFPVLGVYL